MKPNNPPFEPTKPKDDVVVGKRGKGMAKARYLARLALAPKPKHLGELSNELLNRYIKQGSETIGTTLQTRGIEKAKRRMSDIRKARLRVLNAGSEERAETVHEDYPPPVETDYYKGLRLHFARGNRGGKSSSARGGASAAVGSDHSSAGGNGGGDGGGGNGGGGV